MGLRGPRPIPTAILRIRGSWRAKINRNQPTPPPGAPACPSWLDEPAKAMWQELQPMLAVARVLTRFDANVFARYCALWSRWRQAEDFLRQYGPTYVIKDKRDRIKCIVQHPQVSIAHKTALLLGKLEQELGLTPSARSRVVIAPLPDPDPNSLRNFLLGPPKVVGQAPPPPRSGGQDFRPAPTLRGP